MIAPLNLLNSTLISSLRGWQGIQSRTDAVTPPQRLQLFDRENCPYCRLVREALNELNLDVEIFPVPAFGRRYRDRLEELSGKTQVPFLVDPNTETKMGESMDIVRYLFETYGHGDLPLRWQMGPLQTISSTIASAARLMESKGGTSSYTPEIMLELYSFEASPYARPVRELLSAMEIPYVLKSCGRSELAEWLLPPVREHLKIPVNSKLTNRIELQDKEGKMSIPYLWDPNREKGLFESDAIMDYLKQEYGKA